MIFPISIGTVVHEMWPSYVYSSVGAFYLSCCQIEQRAILYAGLHLAALCVCVCAGQDTTVKCAKIEDTATHNICILQCFKLSVFFRSLYIER